MPQQINQPPITDQLLPGHAGRGRGGYKPLILVMHIQAGYGNPWGYFKSLGDSGPDAADSTIWNPRADDASLVRYLYDSDEAWTNGSWTEPINHANPVLDSLYRNNVYSGSVSLTVENEGQPGDGITEAQLQRLIALCAWWCQTYDIPADRNHIVGHYEIGPHKYCPGQLFPFDRLVAGVQAALNQAPPAPEIDPEHPDPNRYIPAATGFELNNVYGLYDYWKATGGLEANGYPIEGATEKIDPDPTIGKKVTILCERQELEFHEADGQHYRWLLGREVQALRKRVIELEGQLLGQNLAKRTGGQGTT